MIFAGVVAAISGAAFGAAFTAAFGEAEALCSVAGGSTARQGSSCECPVLPAAPNPLVRDRSRCRSSGSKSNSTDLDDGVVHGAGACPGIGGSWGNVSGDGTSAFGAGVDEQRRDAGRDAGSSSAGSGGSAACQRFSCGAGCRAAASCVCTTSISSGSKGADKPSTVRQGWTEL